MYLTPDADGMMVPDTGRYHAEALRAIEAFAVACGSQGGQAEYDAILTFLGALAHAKYRELRPYVLECAVRCADALRRNME